MTSEKKYLLLKFLMSLYPPCIDQTDYLWLLIAHKIQNCYWKHKLCKCFNCIILPSSTVALWVKNNLSGYKTIVGAFWEMCLCFLKCHVLGYVLVLSFSEYLYWFLKYCFVCKMSCFVRCFFFCILKNVVDFSIMLLCFQEDCLFIHLSPCSPTAAVSLALSLFN